jgi:hypothetical protein
MGFSLGSLWPSARAPKPTGASPDGNPARLSSHGGSSQSGAGKPGAESPEHLHDSQPGADNPKSSMFDKLSAVGNIAGAGASIYPLFQSHKENAAPKPPPGEDMTEFNQAKLMTAVGPTPINW